MAEARVRPALPDDTGLLATLELAWWREAYETILPASALQMEPQILADAWAAQLVGAPALIAEEGTHPVGFALLDPRPDAAGIAHVEVLGVLPRWARRGHGGRLLARCAELMVDAGATTGAWWALESDETIAAFLAGFGWGPNGHRRILDTGEGRISEVEFGGPIDFELQAGHTH